MRQPSGRSGAAVALYRNVPAIPRYFLGGVSDLRRTSKSLVASALAMARACEYFRTARSVVGPTTPSTAPGSNPKALSLPCNSRISSAFSGAGFAGAGSGICGADGAGGCSNDVAGDGEAGGGEIAGTEAGGGAFSGMSSARGMAAFACSTGLGGNGSEGGKGRPRTARTAAAANSISNKPSQR